LILCVNDIESQVAPVVWAAGSSADVNTDDGAVGIRQQLVTELFLQHGCYPSRMSAVIYFCYTATAAANY